MNFGTNVGVHNTKVSSGSQQGWGNVARVYILSNPEFPREIWKLVELKTWHVVARVGAPAGEAMRSRSYDDQHPSQAQSRG